MKLDRMILYLNAEFFCLRTVIAQEKNYQFTSTLPLCYMVFSVCLCVDGNYCSGVDLCH